MADPISATANIVALLAVGVQSCARLVEFYQKLTDAPAEVRHDALWLRALQTTFGELQTLTQAPRFSDFQAHMPAGFHARLADCGADLQRMEAHLRRVCTGLEGGKMQQTWAKVKHCFAGEQWSAKFSRRLQMYHSAFAIDLATIQIKLTILYNSRPSIDGSPTNLEAPTSPPDGMGVSRRFLAQFLRSYSEPISVRASTWLCLMTNLGSFAFWSGPVLKRTWTDGQPAYTARSHLGGRSDRGFGCQAYVNWGRRRGGFSVFCVSSRHSPMGGLFSVRWSARFPCIIPEQAEIFDFIRMGKLAAVQLLFGAGKASPWDTTPDGRGLLHAAVSSGYAEMVTFLLGQGADANSKDEEGRTPLHIAVGLPGGYDTCRILLEHGADLGNRDADGKTPLHIFFGPVVGMILLRHRDSVAEEVATCDDAGMTILQYTAWSSKSEPQHLNAYLQGDQAYSCVSRDRTGRSLLHFAAQRGNLELLEYLLELPTNPGAEARDASGQSVLHYAVCSKRTRAIELLLAHGADPHAVDSKGRTILHCAAMKNNIAAVKRTLQLCGDSGRHARDKNGLTPAQLAYQNKAFDAARLLGFTEPGDLCTNSSGGGEVRCLSSEPAKRTRCGVIGAEIRSRARCHLFTPGYWMLSVWGLLCCITLLRAVL